MPNNRKRLVGRVVRQQRWTRRWWSSVETHQAPSALYKKVIRTTKKYMAHDESNAIPVGALVKIVESRPISKTKRWVVEEVLEAAGAGRGVTG